MYVNGRIKFLKINKTKLNNKHFQYLLIGVCENCFAFKYTEIFCFQCLSKRFTRCINNGCCQRQTENVSLAFFLFIYVILNFIAFDSSSKSKIKIL
ncbi:hypothetical protein BpHYR1_044519 [Brachionus plicatilis]|uniref:Uncharacterized protein n=1 Tax=Brachionus plicatilis TaxID=10195 RepID=A0A3M7SZ44_BRAPC|nr:hypothetical protein BpHYR1_044519 [Brachionus plicatilis]